jgi:transcriptional regulator GlxA family with amidase domain
VETFRIETAKGMLETSSAAVKEVAFTCGFGDASTLRRVFKRRLQLSPDEYRRRFSQL